mmetsp:Transcript_11784/g.21844  ORF Transcript_11784/g.21844 Transcript_11784/m.21844 type:complete len:245 (-) Transcript_11784:269-1003(-)
MVRNLRTATASVARESPLCLVRRGAAPYNRGGGLSKTKELECWKPQAWRRFMATGPGAGPKAESETLPFSRFRFVSFSGLLILGIGAVKHFGVNEEGIAKRRAAYEEKLKNSENAKYNITSANERPKPSWTMALGAMVVGGIIGVGGAYFFAPMFATRRALSHAATKSVLQHLEGKGYTGLKPGNVTGEFTKNGATIRLECEINSRVAIVNAQAVRNSNTDSWRTTLIKAEHSDGTQIPIKNGM